MNHLSIQATYFIFDKNAAVRTPASWRNHIACPACRLLFSYPIVSFSLKLPRRKGRQSFTEEQKSEQQMRKTDALNSSQLFFSICVYRLHWLQYVCFKFQLYSIAFLLRICHSSDPFVGLSISYRISSYYYSALLHFTQVTSAPELNSTKNASFIAHISRLDSRSILTWQKPQKDLKMYLLHRYDKCYYRPMIVVYAARCVFPNRVA